MDLEVMGRHAMLFDDDGMAAFVNSSDALVQWNSLSIDRYDVRHLLSGPLPPRARRRLSDDSLESELDRERYLDLPSTDQQDLDDEFEAERENGGGYRAVPFSYGNSSESIEQKNAEEETAFRPPFAVPEHLVSNLPPTEKIHQIISRTAMFVSKHGGQSEIILRVKQGNNPTFGFLMPDHDLHPYFRFLVDHQELVKSDMGDKSIEEDKADSKFEQTGRVGALSLLGSVYGSLEDEDSSAENNLTVKSDSVELVTSDSVTNKQEQTNTAVKLIEKDEALSKHPIHSLKERAQVIRKNGPITRDANILTTTSLKKDGNSLASDVSASDKLQASASASASQPKFEAPIVEPPSDLKRVVDKIVEFILRNGKEFELILLQQDIKYGRFPFLLPSNQYHAYYRKVLQDAEESRSAGKGFNFEKRDTLRQGVDRKGESNESDRQALPSDIPHDFDRKEKFKMTIGKKKDAQESAAKPSQVQVGVSVDAAAAAAILQAATKGIKKPNLEILSRTSINGIEKGPKSKDGGNPLVTVQSQDSSQKLGQNGKLDSSEASLTREQKLKAERLKRAKMFAAMIKSGAAPLKSEKLRSASLEAPASELSGTNSQVENIGSREREGSSVSLNANAASDEIDKSGNKASSDSYNERRSKRIYRHRSKRDEDDEYDNDEEERGEEVDKDGDHKCSKKKGRSSHHSTKDRHRHRKRRSSLKDKYSQHRHDYNSVSDDESRQSKHHHKQDSSNEDDRGHHKRRRKHDNSSDDEHRHSKYRSKHDSSSADEDWHSKHKSMHDSSSDDEEGSRQHRSKRKKSDNDKFRHKRKHHGSSDDEDHERETKSKTRRRYHAERNADLEEGEILVKPDHCSASEGSRGVSREASVDLTKPGLGAMGASEPSQSTVVSNDLRAKIRAMLMETL